MPKSDPPSLKDLPEADLASLLESLEDDAPAPRSRAKNRLRPASAPRTARTTEREPRREKRPQVEPNPLADEIKGGLLALGAVLFFFALFSYDPFDLPPSLPGNPADRENVDPVNFMGRLGAIVAFYSLMLCGMAVYLLPFSGMWFGVCKVVSQTRITGKHWLGVVIAVITGAAIIDLSGWQFGGAEVAPWGNGGVIGRMVGGKIALNVLGPIGSVIVLGVVYATGVILVSGMRPTQVIASLREEMPTILHHTWDRIMNFGRRAITEDEPLVATLESPKAAKGRGRAKQSPIGSSTATEPPVELFAPQQLSFDLKDAPKIIDASAPKIAADDDTRPRLADVWQKKRQQKIEQTGPAPAGSLSERYADYQLPALNLLQWPDPSLAAPTDQNELRELQETIVRCLKSFQIDVSKGDITRGPAITRYEVRPVDGLRVSRIAQLEPDIARATRAERINILAPIPGKDTVGIEIANKTKVLVPLRELLEDDVFQNGKSKLPVALGKDVYGKTIIADLAAMPHLLVAGATGSGKSVCINAIIASLLCRFAPDELRFVMIDPKVVEMQTYASLPHLALPVVTDPKKALMALRWVVKEMETRYQIFAQEGCRNFDTFNNRNRKKKEAARAAAAAEVAKEAPAVMEALPAEEDTSSPFVDDEVVFIANENAAAEDPGLQRHHINPRAEIESLAELIGEEEATEAVMSLIADSPAPQGEWAGDSMPPNGSTRAHRSQALIIPDTLPFIVIIIDELADLMQTAPADIEVCIARITQMARAAGIHLIIATQTPRADVITGVIKANVPSRIAFQVSSSIDSRVILDRKGAEKLVGKGDMLYLPPGTGNLVRSQGALVTDDEIHALVDHCVSQGTPVFDSGTETMGGAQMTSFGDEEEGEEKLDSEEEKCLERCLEVVRLEKKASTSLFQRRLGIGYGRAARMLDLLEDRGIIGPGDGAKPREILVRMD